MKSTEVQNRPTYTGSARQLPDGRMEAIACGVQARLDERTGYSKKVTDETVDIARTLGVADREIKAWINYRLKQLAQDEARLRGIKVLLERVRADIPDMS
jgi:hypothetical protein